MLFAGYFRAGENARVRIHDVSFLTIASNALRLTNARIELRARPRAALAPRDVG
jgi:hypothetical protein